MASKKGMIMSLSVDPDIQEKMKAVAKKRNISVSKLIRDMVEKNLPNVEEEVDVVVLKVPLSLRGDDLKNWLLPKVDAIVKALSTP